MSERVQLLGDGGAGHALPADKRGALLAYLAFDGGWLPREQVAFLFWPDTDEASARRNLRQLLARVKSLPLAAPLEVESRRLRWAPSTDLGEFRHAFARQAWGEVVELYRGDLLAGHMTDGTDGFGAWLELERENLRHAYRRALTRAAEELESAGDHAAAAERLAPLLDTEELAEEALQAYMRNAYLAGQRDLALGSYRRFAARLAEELDLEPLHETRALADAIGRAVPLERAGPAPRQPARAPLTVQRPPTLVGREDARGAALAAVTPVVLLSGEAGVGKSRLLEELAPGAATVRCLEGLQSVPYQPLVELVRGALRAGADLAHLEDYRDDLARLVPEALPGQRPPPADAATATARLLEALARFLEGAFGGAGQERFDLLFDDLQWADDGTLELLALLASRRRLRVLGAFRRYEVSDRLRGALAALRSAHALTVVDLEPLGETELRRLLAVLIGVDEGPPVFSQWLHQSSAGNVMFALETLKSLFESGVLASDRSGWHTELDSITRDYRELETPAAISEVVERRAARFSSGALRTLQAAAVMREGFGPDSLGAVAGLSEWEVADALDELEAGGMIAGERFRHDLLRQSVYQGLPEARRKLLHGRAAKALDAAQQPIVVSEHLLAAGDVGAATTLQLRAAKELQDIGLHEQATLLLERTLATVEGQGRKHEAAARLKAGLANLYRVTARPERAAAMAEAVLAETDEPELVAAALETTAGLHLVHGRLDEAGRAARRSRELAESVGAKRLAQSAAGLVASVAYYQGRLEEALAIIQRSVDELREEGSEIDLASQLTSLGVLHDELGDSEKALPIHLEALALVRKLRAKYHHVDVAINLVQCYAALGRDEDGLAVAEEALALGRYEGTSTLLNNYAGTLMDLGRLEEAAANYETLTAQEPDPTIGTLSWARLTRIYASLGRGPELAQALDHTLAAVALTEFPIARVAAANSLFEHGGAAHRRAAIELARALDRERLPPHLLEDVKRLSEASG